MTSPTEQELDLLLQRGDRLSLAALWGIPLLTSAMLLYHFLSAQAASLMDNEGVYYAAAQILVILIVGVILYRRIRRIAAAPEAREKIEIWCESRWPIFLLVAVDILAGLGMYLVNPRPLLIVVMVPMLIVCRAQLHSSEAYKSEFGERVR